ncbi:ABC transporter substrate-binding protein [Brevibacterium samyangense]|uniref:ABC transporter substrate-binding protein n=1 Tax=Brevibacterium samyangense TaxID=366888 RepID=A0ABP5F183_9MICO
MTVPTGHRAEMRRPSRLRRGFAAATLASAVALAPAVLASPALATESIPETPVAVEAEPTTLRIATSGFVDTFNPFTSVYLTPTQINRFVYYNLVLYSQEDGSVTGGLAESWESNDAGTEWTYTLVEGAKWSDGEPITAEDVKWTYDQMIADSEQSGMASANGSMTDNFASVEAVDERTVKIVLEEAQAAVPGQEVPIVPKHIWETYANPTEEAADSEVVGSGPYVLEGYQPNQRISLRKNPEFFGEQPGIDRIEYIYYTDAEAQVAALRAGEVDFVTGLTPEQYEALEGEEGITLNNGIGRKFYAISVNSGSADAQGNPYGTGHVALTDPKVRQALRQAIDADTLRQQIIGDYAVPGTELIPASYPQFQLPADDPAILPFDPESSKTLLDEAGWTDSDGDGIRDKDGEPLALRLTFDSESSYTSDAVQFLEPWLEEVGIDLVPEPTDSGTEDERATAGDYDLRMSQWSVGPDPDYQLGINTCASRPNAEGVGGTSQDGWCNPEFDALYQQQKTELDPEKRAQLVHDAQRIHYTDTAAIYLWYPNQLEAYRSDRFTNFQGMPAEGGQISGASGPWGFAAVQPVEGGDSGGGMSTGAWIGIGAAAVVLLGGGGFLAARRKKTADSRE